MSLTLNFRPNYFLAKNICSFVNLTLSLEHPQMKNMVTPKTFLKSFWQIISILKIFSLQTLSLFLLSYSGGLLAEVWGVRGCSPRSEFMGIVFYFTLAFGVVSFVVALHPIIFPSVWLEEISKEFTGSQIGFRFPFFSTHPSYIFLDALLFIPALILYWNGQTESLCEFNSDWGQGVTALIVSIIFPTLRLIFWYVLGKQIYAMQVRNVWLGIIWWYLLTLPVIVIFSITYVENNIYPRLNIPVVDAQTFKNGLGSHPEFLDKIVRLRGNIKQGIAKCGLWGKKDRTDFPYGTVVLDMGDGNGEIIVQAKKVSHVLNLEAEAESKKGQVFETFGRLSKLPNPEKKMLCGISNLPDDPPLGGRALLEIEIPQ